jgi:MutS domain V
VNATDTQTAHVEYERRLQACRGRITAVSRREAVLGNARFLYFVALAGTLIYLVSVGGLVFVSVLIGAGLVFILLGYLHQRVQYQLTRLERAAAHYERGLARLDDRWAGTGQTGIRYLDPEHPYAVDLDIFGSGSVYELLCTARTRRGEDTLAAWLQGPAPADEILSRQEAVRELTPRVDLREELALLGGELPESADFDRLAAWGRAGLPPVAGRVRVVTAWLAALPTTGALIWFALGTPLPLLGLIAITGWFTSRLRPRVHAIIDTVERQASDLSLLAGILARLESEPLRSPRLRRLQEIVLTGGVRPSARIAELVRMIDWLNARYNPFFAPIGLMVLWTTQWALAIEAWRARVGPAFERWLDAVGQFEALAALSGYAYDNPQDPFPEILSDRALFDGTALAHPLLPRKVAVCNDVALGDAVRVLVVSGSNMAGKSTLLRTVGVNAVLALAGAPVRAARLRLSVLTLGATLRTQDSLQAGRSRFYAEIVRLRKLLELTKGPYPLLFLLDEILHGTNSHDRRLGAEGVIRSFVARGAIGLVTTHDLALTQIVDMFAPHAANIHFADQFADGQLTFDYRIRPGIAGHGNALDLMRSIGLDV